MAQRACAAIAPAMTPRSLFAGCAPLPFSRVRSGFLPVRRARVRARARVRSRRSLREKKVRQSPRKHDAHWPIPYPLEGDWPRPRKLGGVFLTAASR
eukprot:30621-Pelagococcus_subviridis.AAC.2